MARRTRPNGNGNGNDEPEAPSSSPAPTPPEHVDFLDYVRDATVLERIAKPLINLPQILQHAAQAQSNMERMVLAAASAKADGEELQRQNATLQDSVNNLSQTLAEEKAQMLEQSAENARLHAATVFEAELAERRLTVRPLEEEVAMLKEQLASVRAELESARSDLSQVQHDTIIATGEKQQLDTQLRNLREQWATIGAITGEPEPGAS